MTMQIPEMTSPRRMFLIAKRLFMTGAKNTHYRCASATIAQNSSAR